VYLRYSRSDLLSLRYEGKSRQRPQCSNRVELQTLHFWKVNLNALVASSSSSLASCSNYANQSKNRLSPETDNSSLNSSNNGSISSRRAMRNRERANNYYQRFVPSVSGDPLPICGEEKEKSFKSPPIIDHRSISSSHLMPAFAKRRFAAVNGGSSNGSEAIQNTCDDCWKISSSDLEINPEGSETERRFHYAQLDPQCSSPTFSSSRLERQRIGSGRLLVNSWEYTKSQKAKESSLDIDKETSFNGNNRQRTFSGRITENIDRRFQYDNNKRHSDNRQNVSTRRANNKEALNNRGKRLNTYHHDRNEEPEWFSAGPTSQLETIDLHGFDDFENNEIDKKDPEEEIRNKITLSENNKNSNLAVQREVDGVSTSKDKNDTKEKQNKNQSNSDTQFNFDAFLNMHPLDHTLMTNDEIAKDEIMGTSRFSRWFHGKDASNNTETLSSYHEPLHVKEKHGIPSVKDLEAQMTKVDMRPSDFRRADDQRDAPVSTSFSQITSVEKPVASDTEAFKKLLQQLGGSKIQPQVKQQPSNQCENDVSFHLINNPSYELTVEPIRKTDQRVPQQLHLLNINTTNNTVHELEHKRMEIQQIMQDLDRGDISVELLEKELHNPITPPHSKEMIATVIREYMQHTKRNPATVVHSDPHLVVTSHSAFLQHEGFHHGTNQQLNSGHSHVHTNSQTPLAFTPTSVLRKMTADKDTATSQIQNSSHNQHLNHQYQLNPQPVKQQESVTMTVHQQQHPRMILGSGGNFALGLNSQQMSPNLQQQYRSNQNQMLKWNAGVANMHMMHGKSFGRPILKGGPNSLPQIQIPAVVTLNQKMELQHLNKHQQHHHQMQQQQQQLRFKTSAESNLNTESLHQNINFPDGFPQHNFQQQHNLLLHHQQQRQSLRPRVIYGEIHQQQQQQQHHHQANFPVASAPLLTSGFHDLCGDSGNVVKNNSFHRDERMQSPSPSTNNQLAQWFSPELLAKASAGKLPHLNQSQALSLEEFERSIQHSSAVAHN
ncbi:hypothetical protein KR032_006875, partial [Drosophila birchii]